MRVLSLDIGSKNTGVAISDYDQVIISVLGVIKLNKFNGKTWFAELKKLLGIQFEQVETVVIGYPFWDHANAIVLLINQVLRMIGSWTNWKIVVVDEAYSSAIASEWLLSMDYNFKQVKAKIDAYAALYLLYKYMLKNAKNPLVNYYF